MSPNNGLFKITHQISFLSRCSVWLILAFIGFFPENSRAATLPAGFQETTVFSGLVEPTAVRFASDGRIFVAEKRGVIKVFDNVNDTTPTIFADLNVNVYNFWDRGLLGLALHPNFPSTPYLYVLYTYDAEIGGTAPRWGTPGNYSDTCPTPPGATGDGCVVAARLSRLEASGNTMVGPENVFIEDWCQQYPSHSIGSLAFGSDGALYVSGGDGASFNFVDYGQDGSPLNPCGDPPAGVGGVQTPPTAEGGALRSQDLRTPADPTTLDGAILRINPANGEALPDNPLASSSDPNAARIIAYGLRNPFRMTVRPGTNELWFGEVGWSTWEEINRVVNPTAGVLNFGWPCYEGISPQSGYDGGNFTICENLYSESGSVTPPYFAYNHNSKVVPNESCPSGGSSSAGIVFYTSGPYPENYDGAMFFADYTRKCIWAMFKGGNGLPDPNQIITFAAGAANPVDLQISPTGQLYYVDFLGGTVRRIDFVNVNQPPVAVAEANPTSGSAPLQVSFDGSNSTDPDPGDTLMYAWDLDGDGQFDDATTAVASYTYSTTGNHIATLRVTDSQGMSDTDSVTITVNTNSPPVASLTSPSPDLQWKVNDVISFSATATDPEQGNLPDSAFTWRLLLHHCPSSCHVHVIQTFTGVKQGTFTAPDHEYPAHLELQLTVTDAGGLQDNENVILQPRTVVLTFKTKPGGFQLIVGGTSGVTTFTRTVIVGSRNTISAPSPQTKGNKNHTFSSWSDGGAQTHDIIAPANNREYTAKYVRDR